MFKRKKRTVNKVFGELNLWGNEWTTSEKISFVLWEKKYELNLCIVENCGKSGISKLQEDIYLKFQANVVENQEKIEQIVSHFFETTDVDSLISRFIPYELLITTNGECALIAENTDDEDIQDVLPGLAVVIYPKMAIYTEEAYSEYVFFERR